MFKLVKFTSIENKEEIDSEKNLNVSVKTVSLDEVVLDINRLYTWKKLIRVTAYIYKYISKKPSVEKLEETSGLNEVEFKAAEMYWILRAQKQLDLSSSQVKKLLPFRDGDGIIWIYRRNKHMLVFDLNRKHPVLLLKEHKVSLLIGKPMWNVYTQVI